MRHIRLASSIAALGAFVFASCNSEERPLPTDTGRDASGNGGQSGSGSGNAGTSQGGTEGGPETCATKVCRGPATCVEVNGGAECVCDEGYENVADECVVDEECIELRLIEPKCRQREEAEPAVAMLFDVATCAGTTVKPEVLGDIDSAFSVLENGSKLGAESYATILDRDVESYVVIAVDLSKSVTEKPEVSQLREHLKALVSDLEPQPGESAVYVQLIPFGRSTRPALPDFSADFALLSDKIDEIFDDLATYVPDPNGTNLNGVINTGAKAIEDKLKLLLEDEAGGVVSTGTVLSITDGKDNSGVKLDGRAARYNLISVGISDQVDDKELTRVGPQGSFLAPTPEDWQASFQAVAQRVAEYPRRSYLLAYCSPAVGSQQTIAVTWANGTAKADATCKVDASKFGQQAACNDEFIANYCSDPQRQCAGFLGCGACSPDAGAVVRDWGPESFY